MASATIEDLEGRVSSLERASGVPTMQAARSRRLRIRFPAADTPRDIVHGLSEVPDGYVIEFATANIFATPGRQWTVELAYLQADAANAEAVITFYVSTEATQDG